jgi:dolichol kinase
MTASEFEALVDSTAGLQPLRRLFHAVLGLGCAVLLWTVDPPRTPALVGCGSLALLLLAADLIRLAVPRLNVVFFRTFRVLTSPREARGIASSTWYVVGILACLVLFPMGIVVPAIIVLAVADPAAHYVGRRWGARQLGTGTVEGAAAFVMVGFLLLRPFVPGGTALVAALVAALAELLPWKLDDNLVIPLSVATVLSVNGGD